MPITLQDSDIKRYIKETKHTWTPRTEYNTAVKLSYLEKFIKSKYPDEQKLLRDIGQQDIIDFRHSLLYPKDKKGISPDTAKTYLYSVKGFYRWLKDNGHINVDPIPSSVIEDIKVEEKFPIYLTDDELQRLYKAAKDKRQLVITQTLYYTGFRVSELVSIKKGDIDFTDRTIRVKVKGGKWDYHEIPSALIPILKDYCGGPGEGFDDDRKIFDLHTSTIEMDFRAMRKRANISKHVTPHTLRHTFARYLITHNFDPRDIQKLLRHNSLSSTGRYLVMKHENINQKLDAVYSNDKKPDQAIPENEKGKVMRNEDGQTKLHTE